MAELVNVVRASDGAEITVDIDTAQYMRDAGTLTIADPTAAVLSIADVYGADYEAESGIGQD